MSVTKRNHTQKLVGMALFSAIVVVLQLLGAFIRFGQFSVSLVLIPIVVGAAVYGIGAGAWLGFVFGVAVLLSGDAAAFLAINPIGTVITVLMKGTMAGLAVDLLYSSLSKVNKYLAVFVSAVVCPVVNTGVFLIGCKLFFWETIKEWSAATEYGGEIAKYVIFIFVGGNFLFELIINILMSPTVIKVINIGRTKSVKSK